MEAFSAFLRASLTQCEHGLGIYVDHMWSIFSIKHLYLNGICKSRLVVEKGKEKKRKKRKKKKKKKKENSQYDWTMSMKLKVLTIQPHTLEDHQCMASHSVGF
jgi:hypothetical protein